MGIRGPPWSPKRISPYGCWSAQSTTTVQLSPPAAGFILAVHVTGSDGKLSRTTEPEATLAGPPESSLSPELQDLEMTRVPSSFRVPGPPWFGKRPLGLNARMLVLLAMNWEASLPSTRSALRPATR